MKRQIGHWMTRDVLHARPDAPLMEALEMMADRQIRHVLVIDAQEEIRGIVSNRDIIRAALRHPQRKLDLHGTPLRDVMTEAPLRTTSPYATLGEAAELMSRNKVSALPVMEGGHLEGIITSEDILLAVSLGDQPAKRPDV